MAGRLLSFFVSCFVLFESTRQLIRERRKFFRILMLAIGRH